MTAPAPQPIRYGPGAMLDPPRPGGRWHKVLRALDRGSTTNEDLVGLLDDGRYPLWRLKNKIRIATRDMALIDLLHAGHAGWVRTEQGDRVLQDLDRREAARGRG